LSQQLKKLQESPCTLKEKDFPRLLKRFVDDAFAFFDSLSDDRIIHRPCKHPAWKALGLRCVNFRKKYVVSYLDNADEIIICE
jgi:hypothetical protein